MKVAIVGAGGHGKVACEIFELMHGTDHTIAFFDDGEERKEVLGHPVVGLVDALLADPTYDRLFVAIGDNKARAEIVGKLAGGTRPFLTLVHPFSALSPHAHIGYGTIAIAGTVVNAEAAVGTHVILNTHCSVGHDCQVEDFAQVAPGVNLGGGSVIERGAFLGIGAKVVPKARVGAWSVVGAGSVVLDDIPPNSFAYGTPARVVRKLEEGR